MNILSDWLSPLALKFPRTSISLPNSHRSETHHTTLTSDFITCRPLFRTSAGLVSSGVGQGPLLKTKQGMMVILEFERKHRSRTRTTNKHANGNKTCDIG